MPLEESDNPDLRVKSIFVDLKKGLTTPSVTTVNLVTGDALVVQVGGLEDAHPEDIETTVSIGERSERLWGTRLLIQFEDCGTNYATQLLAGYLRSGVTRSDALERYGIQAGRGDRPRKGASCPLLMLRSPDGSSLLVFAKVSKDRSVAHLVTRHRPRPSAEAMQEKTPRPSGRGPEGVAQGTSDDNAEGGRLPTSAVADSTVRLVRRHWSLSFSAGLATLPWSRDHRYRLEGAGTDTRTIREASRGGLPYAAATFAHYDLANIPFASLSFGLSAQVPAEELSLLLGVSARARTLPIGKSGYLTAGVSLSPMAMLSPDFDGKYDTKKGVPVGTVPATTTVASLTEKRRSLGGFFAITFVFAGGNEGDFGRRATLR